LGPEDLDQIMQGLFIKRHPNLIVGGETADDAGVFRLTDELALVQTLDFFTPIVDDPFDFGRIAAANALSDVYAMGGTPLTAMNIVCFPRGDLPLDILRQTLLGGLEKIEEAGAALVGGHSVDIQKSDKEYRAKISGPGQHAGAGAYAAPVGSSDKLTSLAPSSGRLLVHRLQEQPSALDAASAALERQREKIEEALTLLKQAIPRQEEGGLKNSVTELNERLDELARKLDEISDGTIKNYVGEILNRLDK